MRLILRGKEEVGFSVCRQFVFVRESAYTFVCASVRLARRGGVLP